MPWGTMRGTISDAAGAALLSSAEATGSRESGVGAGGASWALAQPAHAHARKREQTPRERAIVGAPIPPYNKPDAAPEASVACHPPQLQPQATHRPQFP